MPCGVTVSFFSFELDPALAADPVFDLHKQGKMAITCTVPLSSRDDLSRAYTPGVARVCEAIAADPELAADYTWTANTVAVVTDDSRAHGVADVIGQVVFRYWPRPGRLS